MCVPQGSVLGPLTFLIFINDICDIAIGSVFTKLFANDLKIYTEVNTNCSSSDLQAGLSRLQVWTAKWHTNIAVDKCYSVRPTYGNRRHTNSELQYWWILVTTRW